MCQEIPDLLWNLKIHYCIQKKLTGPYYEKVEFQGPA
jgi:hypothetical protein